MASLCLWIFLLSELYFRQAALKQLAYSTDKTVLCIARSDALIQHSVLTPAVSTQHLSQHTLCQPWWLSAGAVPSSQVCMLAVPAFPMCAPLCVPLHAVAQAQSRSPVGGNMLKKWFTARTTCYRPITGSPPACHEESQCVSDLCGFGCTQPPQLVKNICSLKIGDAIYYSGFLLTTDLKSLGISHLWSFQGCVFWCCQWGLQR